MSTSEAFSRMRLLIGDDAAQKLAGATVAVFGVGGVGGYCVEALARCGVEKLVIVDNDLVAESNLNRQIIATRKTIGLPKVEVMKERILDINPAAEVDARMSFFTRDNAAEFDFASFDYVVDAIDTVSSKLALVELAQAAGTPILSCMGAGNKLDPTKFQIADINQTSVCPLARVMRYELRKRGVRKLKVLFSTEPPMTPQETAPEALAGTSRRSIPASISFVPSAAGLIIAGEVVRDLIGDRPT